MQEPYRSIQDIGETTEALNHNSSISKVQLFSDAQLLLNQLLKIRSDAAPLSPDWQEYTAHIEQSLHRIQTEARSQIDRHEAAQVSIQTQARLNRDEILSEQEARQLRRDRKQKIKVISLTAAGVLFIGLLVGAIAFYQWNVVSSDESWFRDLSQKRWQLIEKRIRLGKSVETRDYNGITGLLYLAQIGSVEDLKRIQALGADVFATDNKGRTALHHAAAAANPNSVEWLLEQGLDVNMEDHTGTTPLHYLFQRAPGTNEGLATCEFLINRGADTTSSNQEESLLMAAVHWSRNLTPDQAIGMLTQLIQRGADVNYVGVHNSSALKNALTKYLPETPNPIALQDSDPIIRLLLESGARMADDENLEFSREIQPGFVDPDELKQAIR